MSNPLVVIYSGGMDSFTLLHEALQTGRPVHALSFHYGQRHARELHCAEAVCLSLGVPHQVADIRAITPLLQGSALTGDLAVPEGGYQSATMQDTVVPNRNMVLLSLAIGHAVTLKADAVWYGAHGGDHAIYPDCRPAFVAAMDAVSRVANYDPVAVEAPYLHLSKQQILAKGLAMGLDYQHTWTCYNGRDKACGRCSACHERLQAFAGEGVSDPLPYEEQV
ncbi:MAG: 7-cyano-7-deazaguanine synthase QueC [Halomonadaceae bacterium]|nr:MAG: 7-cyano-7-deazaguanine synthase QueC [Halomonadaceae bacterium]